MLKKRMKRKAKPSGYVIELKMYEKGLYPAVEKFLKTQKNFFQNTLILPIIK